MKKLFISLFTVASLTAAGFPQMMGGMHGKEGSAHMDIGMMMYMMQDPEVMKMIMEHRRKCMRELMEKLAKRPATVKRMMNMILMHPETAKEVLESDPELREKFEELLR